MQGSVRGIEMGLFTFFVEKSGATLIEQFSGSDVHAAIAEWYLKSAIKPGPRDPDEGWNPTPVTDTQNVWCLSGIDPAGDSFLVHVTGPLAE
jgi:hypothetical protein